MPELGNVIKSDKLALQAFLSYNKKSRYAVVPERYCEYPLADNKKGSLAMSSIIPPSEKRCPKCGIVKPTLSFRQSDSSYNGLSTYCKVCDTTYRSQLHQEQFPDGIKRCSTCKNMLPLEGFFNDKRTRDKHGYECKSCHRARMNTLVSDVPQKQRRTLTQRPKEHLPSDHKRCLRCDTVKSHSEFAKRTKSKDGYYSYCKHCDNKRTQHILPTHKRCNTCGEVKEASAFYLITARKVATLSSHCRECEQTKARTYSTQTYSYLKQRRGQLKTYYDLSLHDYEAMLQAQNGVCAACQQPETTMIRGRIIPLAVDHNKTTGRVRALLCAECNKAFGLLHESSERIAGLLRYAEEQKKLKGGGDMDE